jgi:enoyl-CoA hydratase/carnithine racemase
LKRVDAPDYQPRSPVALITMPDRLGPEQLRRLGEIGRRLTGDVRSTALRFHRCGGLTPEAVALGTDLIGLWHRATDWLTRPDLQTTAIITGAVAGAACNVVLACDTRIANDDAAFRFGDAALGGHPWLPGIHRLTGLGGPSVAQTLLLSGEEFDPGSLGCAVFDEDDDLLETADELALARGRLGDAATEIKALFDRVEDRAVITRAEDEAQARLLTASGS